MIITNKYLQRQVDQASPIELIVLLYEGAIRFLNSARKSIHQKDIELASTAIIRARSIITELMSSLDMEKGLDTAQNLLSLYAFIYEQLVYANIYKEVQYLDNAEELLTGLLDAWRNIASETSGSTNERSETPVASGIDFSS